MQTIKSLVSKYNVAVPRYTSYPPANHFLPNFDAEQAVSLLKNSNHHKNSNISFYIHIPFCKKLCYYCGCNACAITNNKQINEYFDALKTEIEIVTKYIDKNRKISQIHFGGGTPNAVNVKFIDNIIELLAINFSFIDEPEIAIECHPAYLDFVYLENLVKSGFNRFSLGIQDFDAKVLKTINRQPSLIPVNQIVDYIKKLNCKASVNLDFIYGLPHQTTSSFLNTINKALEIKPDRLVTFSYAHVPWLKKHQLILEKAGLPDALQKTDMFLESRKAIIDNGYIPIGLDHYVLPTDELAVAADNNNLHRNFQGYCTKRTTGQVYAFGVSAIGQLFNGYYQNNKNISLYIDAINLGKLPVDKGLIITNNQKIIGYIIEQIMCNKTVDFNKVSEQYNIELTNLFEITGFSLSKIESFINDNLLIFSNNVLQVTTKGGLFIRNIAAVFDPNYQTNITSYSKSV